MQTVSESALSSDQIERYRQDGYLGPFQLCTEDEMAALRLRIAGEVFTTSSPWHGRPQQTRHLDNRLMYDLCTHPAILDRMACIFGPDLLLWQSNFFNKEAGDKAYPWHQDINYWPIEPALNISAWVAVTDASRAAGCLRVIPGSHKAPRPHVRKDDPRYSTIFRGEQADPDHVDESAAIELPMRPGEFVLFNEKMLHSSGPNETDQPRLGLAVRVTIPMVKVYHDHPVILVRGEDRIGCNDLASPPEGKGL